MHGTKAVKGTVSNSFDVPIVQRTVELRQDKRIQAGPDKRIQARPDEANCPHDNSKIILVNFKPNGKILQGVEENPF